MSSTDSAFKALRTIWVALAVIAVTAIVVLLAVLVKQGSEPPPKEKHLEYACAPTAAEGCKLVWR